MSLRRKHTKVTKSFLKECLDILIPSITKLVNCSLSEGFVQEGFQKAVVTPLIKKASLSCDDIKNDYYISGLCIIFKPDI